MLAHLVLVVLLIILTFSGTPRGLVMNSFDQLTSIVFWLVKQQVVYVLPGGWQGAIWSYVHAYFDILPTENGEPRSYNQRFPTTR
jgi:hypothetical protein